MAYKRALINGTSPLDMKGINDNFAAIFLKLFGDINMSDVGDSIKSMLYTNWLQPQGEGNLDSDNPLTIRFYVPDNTKEIKKASFNFILSHYRMDSDIAKNNTDNISFSGITTEEQFGLTTYDTGSTFWHGITEGAIVQDDQVYYNSFTTDYQTIIGDNHYHHFDTDFLDHAHDISHIHNFSSTAKLPAHIHNLNKGIVVDTGILPTINVKINETEIPIILNNDTTNANNLDIKDKLVIGNWNTIEISCYPVSETEKSIARITAFGIVELLQNYI